MRKFILGILVLALVAFTGSAFAGTASSNSTVTINFSGSCTITANPITIAYEGNDVSGSFGVDVNCSNGLAWTLTADGGQNALGELRRGASGEKYMTYRFFKDAELTQEVTVSTNTVATGTGNGSAQSTAIYAAVKQADNASATTGNYTDTVAFTVTW